MLAQPLNEVDKGGQSITCVHLSPGLLLPDDDASGTQTGSCSAPPLPPSCASSSFSPPFFAATTSSPPRSSPPFNFLNSPCVPPSVFLPPPISVPPRLVCSLPQTSASSPPIISAALSSHLACISPPSPFYTSPPITLTLYPSPTFSSTTSLAPPSDSSLPPPATCSVSLPSTPVFFTSSPSFLTSPVSPCTSHTSAILPVSPSLHAQPNPPACCSCSSILPRLLTAHRLEMRRLLRRAMAPFGRRLDLLERRSRKKRRRKRTNGKGGEGSAVFRSFCSPDLIPAVTSTSSLLSSSFLSLDRDLSRPPLSCCYSKTEQRSSCSEQEEVRERTEIRNCIDKAKEEENPGRFVGQMRVSVRGRGATEEEVVLTLHNFNHRRKKLEKVWPLQKAVIRQNGYSISDRSSQHALHHLQSAQSGLDSSQSDAFCVSFSKWRFSGFIFPKSLSLSQTYFPLRPCSSFSAPKLLLSGVSVEMLLELWSRAFGSPLRPLRDRTAPPSLSSDHCYVRRPTLSITFSTWRQRRQRANTMTQGFYLPQQKPLPLPSYLVNGLSAPFPADKSKSTPKFGSSNADCSKRVSQIRIRRATPRETPLTPMGLPKVKRLKKKEFSLEEIYTNKNYKSPSTNRSLETIFEEPREKDGALLLIGQQRRRRLLLFPDFTQPRKRKRPQGLGLSVAMGPRKRLARRHCQSDGSSDDDIDLDVMLVKRLSALEDFMTQQGLDV